jgi:hypothetical protein
MPCPTWATAGLVGFGLGWGLGCFIAGWLGAPPACACPLGEGLVVLASFFLTAGGAGY